MAQKKKIAGPSKVNKTKPHGHDLNAVLYSISDGVITTGNDGLIHRLNLNAEVLTGFRESEAAGLHLSEVVRIFDEKSLTAVELPTHVVLEEGIACELAHQPSLVTKDGEKTPITCSLSPITDESGSIIGMVLVFRDKSEDQRLRNELIETESNYREIFNSTNEAIFIDDASTGLIIDVNDAMLRLYGFENKEEVLKGNIGDLSANTGQFTEEVAQAHIKNAIVEGPQVFEWLAKKKNGEVFWTEVSLRKTEIGGKGRILAVVRDISARKHAEEELSKSRETYFDLYNSVSEAIYIQDKQGVFIDVNKGAEKMYGYTRAELIGKTPALVSAPGYNDLGKIAKLAEQVFRTGVPVQFEFYGLRKNGEVFPKNVIQNKGHYFDKEVLIATARDISENKSIENSLKESQQMLRTILDTIPARVFWKDKDLNFIGCNLAFAKDAGFGNPDEIVGKSDFDINWKEYASRYQFDDRLVMETKQPKLSYEEPQTTPDGKTIYLKTSKIPLLNLEGEVIGVLGTYEDITEKKLADELILSNEIRYRSLIENAPDGIVLIDKESRFRYLSPSVTRTLGYTLADAGNFTPDNITHPDDLPEVHTALASLIAEPGKTITITYRLRHKNGDWRWLESTVTNLLHDPVIGSLVFNFRDITVFVEGEAEKQKYLSALEESENKYRNLFESANDAIFLMSEDVFIDCNSRTETLFRCNRNEIIGCKPYELSPEKQPDGSYSKIKALQYIDRAFSGIPQFFEWQHKSFDGTLFNAEVALNQVVINEQKLLQAIVRDISDRKLAEQTTRMQYRIAHAMATAKNLGELFEKVRTELATLIDATNFYIVFYDQDTGMLTSPFEKDEKDNIPSWPADKSLTGKVVKEMKSLLMSRQQILDLADNGEIILRGSRAESWLGVPLSMNANATGAIVVQSYYDPNAYNQSSIEIMEIIANQLSIYIHKMSNEKELLVAKMKAEESDRLKTAFLNNMSHEIRTPMNGILGFTNLLTSPDANAEERDYYARIINQSSQQLLSIIEDIINISTIEAGQEKLNETETDVNELMKFIYEQFANKVDSQRVLLNYHSLVGQQEALVITDKTKLIQVLSNLIGNAIKFTEKGMIEFQCQLKDGKLHFYVEDSGMGIDPEYHELIFERFRQVHTGLKREYGGNGLGLAISKAYVNLMGGEIWVESEPGKGSAFYFTIPYKPINQGKLLNNEEETKLQFNGANLKVKTILLAEDEYSNSMLIEIILKPYGLNLIHVTNGKDAVEEFRKNPDIGLVLMDLKMPVMNGFEATKIIKKEKPGLPVIAITAYALSGDEYRIKQAGCDDYLAKPVRKDLLVNMVEKHLYQKRQ